MNVRRSLVALVGVSVLLAGCGGSDLPTKSEFSAKVKESLGTELQTAMTDAGVSVDDAKAAINDFVDCTYDKIKDKEDLLKQAYEDSGDKAIQADLEKSAKECTDNLTSAMTGAISG